MSTSEKHRVCHSKSKSDSVDENDSKYECSICYKEAVNPVVLSCGHFYCWECIDEWLNKYAYNKKQCPICKRRVRDGDVIPIYGKGMVSHCENPRPSAPAQNRKNQEDMKKCREIKIISAAADGDNENESQSLCEDSDWTNFIKVGTAVVGLIAAFMLGRQTAKRTRKN